MNKFKIGDNVICIRADCGPIKFNLQEGEIYQVTGLPYNGAVHIDGFQDWMFSESRFEKVSDTVNNNGIIELNGVKYQVENIPWKGECLVPVKRTPKTGEVWKGPKGGIYIVTGFNVNEGYELLGNMVYTIPPSAEFVANSIREAIQKGLIK